MNPDDESKKALARAYRILSVRARSEEEIRRALSRAGFGEQAVDAAVSRLREQGYIDDHTFAADWTRSRAESRPRSKWLIERELAERGVSQEDAAAATSELDDEATALALATRRARFMKGLDRHTCVRRLSHYLLSRGFSGETVSRAVASALAGLESSKPENGHDTLMH
ncbi:MAG: regulatory protein RecX [Dehalococcoidia bacterium]|nr:regulatory protein RecX [Dehalococcoidia bacterium]